MSDNAVVVRKCRRCDREFEQARLARHAGRYRRYCSEECGHAARLERRDNRGLVLQRYDMTRQGYDRMLAAQGGMCRICRTDRPGTKSGRGRTPRFCVDHDHRTGRVRGLLCRSCNSGIGHLQDDPSILARAIAYLTEAA